MSLSRMIDFRRSLALRLTLWYAGMFTISSAVAFLMFYLLITAVLRQQIDTELVKQVDQLSAVLNLRGVEAVKEAAVLEARAGGLRKIFIRLLSPGGEVFSSTNMDYWRNIGISRRAVEQLVGGRRYLFDTLRVEGHAYRIRILYAVIGPGIVLQVGQSMESDERFVSVFRRIFVTTMAVLTCLAALVGGFMARRALSGVGAVTRTARNIAGAGGSLGDRVPVQGRNDEIDQLATTFNGMLDRIEELVGGIREMSDSIAHDLKSPVTRIRGQAEVALSTAASAGDFETLAANTIEECDRLLDMINTLLTISRAESGADKPRCEPVDLSALVREACELFQPAAEDKGLRLHQRLRDGIVLQGDRRMLQRMIANLLDNAVKYTPAGGTVTVTLAKRGDGRVAVAVADTGIGMAEREIANVFKRFYRIDTSRSQPGTGLGLSLARAVARAHHGDIDAVSRPGAGSTFTATLPQTPPPVS
jgi:heavy metal sensor kinase